MKFIGLPVVLSLGVITAATLTSSPAQAQYVAIPVSNGSFALQGTGTGAGTIYSGPLTLLSPAGTIAITATPNLPDASYLSPPTITANTPIGVTINSISGSLGLNDGRIGSFTNSGIVKLETLATVSGATSSFYRPTEPGVTVSFTVQAGSLAVPQSSISGYPDPQFAIPVTGSFSIDATPTAGKDTVTIAALTPLGSMNLTLTNPDLGFPYFAVTANGAGTRLSGIANGTVNLNDGRTATITNRLVNLDVTARQINGADFWYNEQLPAVATTIQGMIVGGSISVPQSAVTSSPAPVQPPAPVEPPAPVQPPAPGQSCGPAAKQPVTPAAPPPPAAPPAVAPPPVVLPPVAPPKKLELTLGFANNVMLREPHEFINPEQAGGQGNQRVDADDLPEVERSALEFSRIHPGLHGRP